MHLLAFSNSSKPFTRDWPGISLEAATIGQLRSPVFSLDNRIPSRACNWLNLEKAGHDDSTHLFRSGSTYA